MYMTAPADQPFNMDKNKEINPIYQLRLSCSDFVWNWYEEQFREEVREHNGGTGSAMYTSMLITWSKHRKGETGPKGVLGMNIFLRRIIEKVYPIEKPDDFFQGKEWDQKEEIIATAERMTAAYEKEYQRQVKAITY